MWGDPLLLPFPGGVALVPVVSPVGPGCPAQGGGEQQCGKHRVTVITMESSRQFEVFNL